MTTLSPFKEFQERLREKLKDDIGSLIPPAALQEVVETAVKEAFFGSQKDSYGRTTDSWLHTELKKVLEPTIKEEVRAVVAKNKDEINEMISKHIEANQLSLMLSMAVADSIKSQTTDVFYQLVQKLQQQGIIRY